MNYLLKKEIENPLLKGAECKSAPAGAVCEGKEEENETETSKF